MCSSEVSNLLTQYPENAEFGVKNGQIKAEETSGTDTTVTLESKSGWNYEVTRRGKEGK